jgi:hypothetical protein
LVEFEEDRKLVVPGEFFEVRVDASLVTRRSHVSQPLQINHLEEAFQCVSDFGKRTFWSGS